MTDLIKHIIFDFGGIIVDLDKKAATDAFAALGFEAEKYVDEYRQAGVFTGLELGDMSAEEFCACVRREATGAADSHAVCAAWNRMLTGIPQHRLQAVKSLRSRYDVYMLSNTNAIHWDFSVKKLFPQQEYSPEDCFDRIFLSFEMHLRKPEPAAFRHVLTETGIEARQCLFIDDSAENCAAARQIGLNAFHSQRSDDWLEIFN